MFTEAALNLDVVDNLERYHKTSERFSHILNAGNPIFLHHYVPKVKFNTPQLNSPLAQLVYNKNKRSAFFNKTDAGKLLVAIDELLYEMKLTNEYKEYNVNATIGRVRLSHRQLAFMETGERYNIPHDDVKNFYKNLADALKVFRAEKPKGTEYPFATSLHKRKGLVEESMMLVTTYGNCSHDTPVSFLRYVQSPNGGKLIFHYGNSEMYLSSKHMPGVNWVEFINTLFMAVQELDGKINKDYFNFIFKEDPILGSYNTYLSLRRSSGTTWLTLNTDLIPTNNKVMFMVNEDNYEHLKTFLGGVLYFLRDRN